MHRIILPVFAGCALFGISGAALAAPDDVATTIAKAQKTLGEIDKTIDGINARKGAAPTVMAPRLPAGGGTARRVPSGTNANRARANANANRANANRTNRNARPNPNAKPAEPKKKP